MTVHKSNRESFWPAGLALAGLTVFIVILTVQTRLFRTSVEELAERDMRDKTDLAAEILEPALSASDFVKLREFGALRKAEGIRVSVINLDGKVVYDNEVTVLGDHSRRSEIMGSLTGESPIVVRRSETMNTFMLYCARRVGTHVIRMAIPYHGVTEPVRIAWRGLVTAGFTGGCAVFLIFLLTRRLQNRIGVLAEERDESARQLADARKLEKFRSAFVSNVSHELRTPLTGILGAVEMLVDEPDLSDTERRSMFRILKEQSKRLEALTRDVLALARLECAQAEGSEPFETCDLAEIVQTVFDLTKPEAAKAGVGLVLLRRDAAAVQGSPRLIERAVTNLVDNALRYSGSKTVELSVVKSGPRVVIMVSDRGIGIAPEHQSRIFERFYRIDKARSRACGGTGLGLAIVKHVMQLHGGEVTLSSVPGAGCSFCLHFSSVKH